MNGMGDECLSQPSPLDGWQDASPPASEGDAQNLATGARGHERNRCTDLDVLTTHVDVAPRSPKTAILARPAEPL